MTPNKLYPEVAEALRFASSMCLLHLGAIHRTIDWLADITAELESIGLTIRLVEPSPEAIDEVTAADNEGEVLLIEDLPSLLSRKTCVDILQRMRPALMKARQQGWRVLMVSTVPADLYPSLAGSSILMDAALVQGRPLVGPQAAGYVRSLGVSSDQSIANVVEHSGGSRALLQAFALIELSTGSSNCKRARAADVERSIAERALAEIGPSLCTWLEHWVFESGRDEIYESDVATNYLVALRSAGVIAPSTDSAFVIFPFRNKQLWSDVLGEYLESVVEPPPLWAELVSELFAFERELRVAIRRAMADRRSLETAVAKHRSKILELARRDSVPSAIGLSDIRSPLDWLTLSDLVAVAQDLTLVSPTGRTCGYGLDDWGRLSQEIVPIRNRVAHMRLARKGDLETVRRCRRLWNRAYSRHLRRQRQR